MVGDSSSPFVTNQDAYFGEASGSRRYVNYAPVEDVEEEHEDDEEVDDEAEEEPGLGTIALDDLSACTDSTEDISSMSSESDEEVVVPNLPSGHFVYGDIGEEQVEDDDEEDLWNGELSSIRAGTLFKSKQAVMEIVAEWTTNRSAAYYSVESKKKTWHVRCITLKKGYPRERLHGASCNWEARASLHSVTGRWRIVNWIDGHSCPGATDGNQGRNVTSKIIATLIQDKVRENVGYGVRAVQVWFIFFR